MTDIHAIALGLLQGLTEFLPVSSSGHLVLAQSLIPGFQQPGVLFDALLHGATLLAVLLYFRRDVVGLCASVLPGGDRSRRKLLALIAAGTIPTGLIGVVFKEPLEALFHSPRAAACMLLVTGMLLWISEALARPRDSLEDFGYGRALVVGFTQGVAIVPGISRSGSTIAVASLLGVRSEEAARFSFLLSIPAVIGALSLEMPRFSEANPGVTIPYAAGALAALGAGVWALRFLMSAIRRGRLRWFAVYCWLAGIGYLILGP